MDWSEFMRYVPSAVFLMFFGSVLTYMLFAGWDAAMDYVSEHRTLIFPIMVTATFVVAVIAGAMLLSELTTVLLGVR